MLSVLTLLVFLSHKSFGWTNLWTWTLNTLFIVQGSRFTRCLSHFKEVSHVQTLVLIARMNVNIELTLFIFSNFKVHKCIFSTGQVMRIVSNISWLLNLSIELPHSSIFHVHSVIKMHAPSAMCLLDNSTVRTQVAKSMEKICINEELRTIMKRYVAAHVELRRVGNESISYLVTSHVICMYPLSLGFTF